jgi:hypothetical protein
LSITQVPEGKDWERLRKRFSLIPVIQAIV